VPVQRHAAAGLEQFAVERAQDAHVVVGACAAEESNMNNKETLQTAVRCGQMRL
jgi:hypothetical protein